MRSIAKTTTIAMTLCGGVVFAFTAMPNGLRIGTTMTRKQMQPSKYDIARQFTKGFVAALTPDARSLSESDHWLAGYDAGYGLRAQKNELLNEYLVGIGYKPLDVIRPA